MIKLHPQTEILNIGNYSCLLQCYLYCAGIEINTLEYFKICLHAIDAGVDKSGVAGDCSVDNAERFLNWLTGKRWKVEKKVLCNISGIKKPTPVKYSYIDNNGLKHEHFVVVENGVIIFDPVLNSNSVAKGRPVDARIITLAR